VVAGVIGPEDQWQLHRRVEAAKSMLRDRRLPLAAVAIVTGFADQGPVTRVFLRSVGVWQRNLLD
jgi:AraC family transcriptional regulator